MDLDGTLAEYHGWIGPEHIGKPVPAMLERVKKWIAEGVEVRIFTARVSVGESEDPTFAESQRSLIAEWCKKHVGAELRVTNKKDFACIEIWDDRAIQVVMNTGEPVISGR